MATAITHQRRLTAPSLSLSRLRSDPAYQSFWLLRIGFTVAPIVFGLDQFLNVLTHYDAYLAPRMNALIPGPAASLMYLVGVVEIFAGLVVALKPRYG